jgi:hypothetical protein
MIRSFITFTLSIIVALVVGGLLMAPYLSWKHGSYPQSYPLDEAEEAIENENATSSTAYPDGEVIFFGISQIPVDSFSKPLAVVGWRCKPES